MPNGYMDPHHLVELVFSASEGSYFIHARFCPGCIAGSPRPEAECSVNDNNLDDAAMHRETPVLALPFYRN
jgi:hypothetical protein